MRPCAVRHPEPIPDRCCRCYRYLHHDGYRAKWNGEGPATPAPPEVAAVWAGQPKLDRPPRSSPCIHLGADTGERRLCNSCRGRVSLKLFACDHPAHGPTTLQDCRRCPDYAAFRRPSVRHLLYHVMPVNGNGVWQWNLDQLRRRLPLFNGKRAIAVVTGRGLDPPDVVQKHLAAEGIEWIVQPNSRRLREVQTWPQLWERVASASHEEATFYAHAKGVTHGPRSQLLRWSEVMYEVCLDYLPLVERSLQLYPLCGPFKRVGQRFEASNSFWWYAGTFFWARNDAVFPERLDRSIDEAWWGNEAWPGKHFKPEQGAALFSEPPGNWCGFWEESSWRDVLEPEYVRWRFEQQKYRSVTG